MLQPFQRPLGFQHVFLVFSSVLYVQSSIKNGENTLNSFCIFGNILRILRDVLTLSSVSAVERNPQKFTAVTWSDSEGGGCPGYGEEKTYNGPSTPPTAAT